MIRASLDFRVPKKYIERNRILQAPIVEDFTCQFHDCKVFTKNGLTARTPPTNNPSRLVLTFSTQWET